MKRDTSETPASNGDEALAAQLSLLSARSSPVSLGRVSAHDKPPNSALEALLRQVLEGDKEAWAEVEQSLGESVRGWLRGHPSKLAACCWESEEDLVSLTFEHFRLAMTTWQVRACTSLPTILSYLQACLNAVLLDSLHTKARLKEIPLQGHAHSEEQPGGDHLDDRSVWERIQELLPDVREQRVAFLLFHCNLSPSDILRYAPQEFRDKQDICKLRHNMLYRILQDSDHTL